MNVWQQLQMKHLEYVTTKERLRVELAKFGATAPVRLPNGMWRCSYRPPGHRRVQHVRGFTPENLLAAALSTARAYKDRRVLELPPSDASCSSSSRRQTDEASP
jgi:hypothetical protein